MIQPPDLSGSWKRLSRISPLGAYWSGLVGGRGWRGLVENIESEGWGGK